MAVRGEMPPGEWPREKTVRPWVCGRGYTSCTRVRPCPSCLGKRNRRKGQRGQGKNRRILEDISGTQASWAGKLANEETADWLPVRYESKSGSKATQICTHYLAAERQPAAA